MGWICNVTSSFIEGIIDLCNRLLKVNPFVLTLKTTMV